MQPRNLIASLSTSLKNRDLNHELVDQFVDQLVFCFLLESCNCFVPGVHFKKYINDTGRSPEKIMKCINSLFEIMASSSELWGTEKRRESFIGKVDIPLTVSQVDLIRELVKLDWYKVSPLIFGDILEQEINPEIRVKLGSHYTPEREINDLINPVIFKDLREEWSLIKNKDSQGYEFLNKLRLLKFLDPSCGSGNFLLFCLWELLSLEREVASSLNPGWVSQSVISLNQFHGIEKNYRAYVLSYFTLWIGRVQWYRDYGVLNDPCNGILFDRPAIINQDAIIDLSDPMLPREMVWPEVDYIIGNPPFLASWRMREYLGDDYCDNLKWIYGDRIPSSSDLGVYWFEKARDFLDRNKTKTVGFVMSSSIKYGYSRYVLDRVSDSCRIFFAIPRRSWDGDAHVDVCLIGFCHRDDLRDCILEGRVVPEIYSNLSDDYNVFEVNKIIDISKDSLVGTGRNWTSLCIDADEAYRTLKNSLPEENDFIRPFVGGMDLAQGCSDSWVGFNEDREDKDYIIMKGKRYLASPRTSKHCIFTWMDSVILPDDGVFYVDTDDDFYMGMLQSNIHKVWTLANCGWRGSSRRYKTAACFKSFPFPDLLGKEEIIENIRQVTRELNRVRDQWLYPDNLLKTETWNFQASRSGPWIKYGKEDVNSDFCVVEYPRRVPINSVAREILKKKFLTNLYNLNPSWLVESHRKLDEYISSLYEIELNSSDQEIMNRLIILKSCGGQEDV